MASTINSNASNHVDAVAKIHGAALDFIVFIEGIKLSIGVSYEQVLNIPSRVTNLLARQAEFEGVEIAGNVIKAILEKNHGYTDWTTTHTEDFNAIFSKADALRMAVENNAGEFPASFTAAHQIVYVTATTGVQQALSNLINDILLSIE